MMPALPDFIKVGVIVEYVHDETVNNPDWFGVEVEVIDIFLGNRPLIRVRRLGPLPDGCRAPHPEWDEHVFGMVYKAARNVCRFALAKPLIPVPQFATVEEATAWLEGHQ